MKTLTWLVLACCTAGIYGQSSLRATAGGDQIYSAYGLQTEYKWHKLSGWMGAGYNDGVKVGGFLQVPLKTGESHTGYFLGLGDQRLGAFLDTDEYDSHGFTVRGGSYIHRTVNSSFQAFGGLLSQEMALPYMHTSLTSGNALQPTPLGAILYHRKLSKNIQIHSLTLMGNKLTSIESLGWTPSKSWRFAVAEGTGFGARYFAGSGDYFQKHAEARVSYTVAGKGFQRQEQPYYSTELVGLNAHLTLTPVEAIRLMFAHERSRTKIVGFPSVAGTIDSANLSTSVKGFQISPGVSLVAIDGRPGTTLTSMVSGSRRILPPWRSFGAYIHTDSPSFKQQTIVAVNEFRVSSRLAIRQNYNRMNGRNSFSFGGQWVSNFISFSADQQIYVSPIASAFGGKSVFQAWTFNIRIRTPHGTNANVNSVVTPDGKVQWGGYLSGMRYDSVGLAHASAGPVFSKYIIRGTVLDEQGNGVWGIAVKIGEDTVLSDEAGEFFLDVRNTKPVAVAVAKDSSVQPSYWLLTSAPSVAQGQLENSSKEPLHILVSTLRTTPRTGE